MAVSVAGAQKKGRCRAASSLQIRWDIRLLAASTGSSFLVFSFFFFFLDSPLLQRNILRDGLNPILKKLELETRRKGVP